MGAVAKPSGDDAAPCRHAKGDIKLDLPTCDESLEGVERFRHELADLRKRWDNAFVPERSVLWEAYLDGRCEILIYGECGDWVADYGRDVMWAVRIAASEVVLDEDSRLSPSVYVADIRDDDGGNDRTMFVVIAKSVKTPQRFIRSVFRPYLFEKKFRGTGEGLLYSRQIRTGFEVFPFFSHGEVWHSVWLSRSGSHNACAQMIQCAPEVMDSVSHDQCKALGDRLTRAIYGGESGWLEIGRDNVSLDLDRVELPRKRIGECFKLINVAIGPLNL